MDQMKIGVALAAVAAIILWIGGAYAAEAWDEHRRRSRRRNPPEVREPATSLHGEQPEILPSAPPPAQTHKLDSP